MSTTEHPDLSIPPSASPTYWEPMTSISDIAYKSPFSVSIQPNQNLTAAEKLYAQQNIGLYYAVRADEGQGYFSDAQKMQARKNISAFYSGLVAPEYEEYTNATTYFRGQLVVKDDRLYICRQDYTMDHPWLSADWTEVENLSNYIVPLRRLIALEYDETATYSRNDFVYRGSNIYKCLANISTAEEWNNNHWVLCNTLFDITDTRYYTKDDSRPSTSIVFLVDDSNTALPDNNVEAYVASSQFLSGNDVHPRVNDIVIGVSSGKIGKITNINLWVATSRVTVTGTSYTLFNGVPAAPAANGTYTLRATVANGVVTYSWA